MKRKRLILKVFLGLMAFLVICCGLVYRSLRPQLNNLRSEYKTADVIYATQSFISQNPGQWPRSWGDLGVEGSEELVLFNFNLDPKSATKSDVAGAIRPKSDVYYTYPHADFFLSLVYDELTNGLAQLEQSFVADTITESSTP